MSYIVNVSDKCEEDAKKHNMEEAIEKQKSKIEKDQRIMGNRHENRCYVKSIGRQHRLIIWENRIDSRDEVMVTLARLLTRGGNIYEDKFLSRPSEFCQEYVPSDKEARERLDKVENEEGADLRPKVSEHEYSYLYPDIELTEEKGDDMIVETERWNEESKDEYMGVYHRILENVIFGNAHSDEENIVKDESSDTKILYRYFPSHRLWILIEPIHEGEQDGEEKEGPQNGYQEVLEEEFSQESELLRASNSVRSYPAYVLADFELWKRTQQGIEANLALSPEELQVLESVLESREKPVFPLFINGRPGSGKSTMLQYLFVEYLRFHLQQVQAETEDPLSNPPLYLTYSPELLEDAKKRTESLLKSNSSIITEGTDYLGDEKGIAEFDRSFGYFRDFVRNLLPPEERKGLPDERYVDFPTFRRRYANHIQKSPRAEVRNIEPQVAWHVIRTYIKGMREEESEYMDTYWYGHELPRSQKTVTDETFRLIYEHIWESWYKPLCTDEGYWDDQDVARRVLNREVEDLPSHPAIFCDEAQDFTKVELEMILRLSLYARRRIQNPQNLSRIPFVFAGDPLQTLNPTGFDWDSVQALFHNNIVRRLDPAGTSDLEFNFQELSYNYRSRPGIVQFCNVIQLFRGVAFGIKNLQPQKAWFEGAASAPVYFEYGSEGDEEPIHQSALRKQEETVLIVPCREGEEEAYVKNDGFLREIAWDEERDRISANVLSPIHAKGLQFKRVVLYKFGQAYLDDDALELGQLNPPPERTELSSQKSLPLKYFFNRLYVATSRPRRQLFIVDTSEALSDFWRFVKEKESNLEDLLARYEDGEGWEIEDLSKITRGEASDWGGEQDEPLDLARNFLRRGQKTEDEYLLSMAEQNFEAADRPAQASRTRALKLEVAGQTQKAANAYKEAGRVYQDKEDASRALKSFWKAKAYGLIIQLGNEYAKIKGDPKYEAARLLQSDLSLEGAAEFLSSLRQDANEDELVREELATGERWNAVLRELCDRLVENADRTEETDSETWERIYGNLAALQKEGATVPSCRSWARVAYEARRFPEVLDIWQDLGGQEGENPEWLIEARAEAGPYPERLIWLDKLDRHEAIIDAYENNAYSTLTDEHVDAVLRAYLLQHAFDPAFELIRDYPSSGRYLQLVEQLAGQENVGLTYEAVHSLLHLWIQEGAWSQTVEFVKEQGTGATNADRIQTFSWDTDLLHTLLIKRLSVSDELSSEEDERKRNIQNYLRNQLLDPQEVLKDNLSAHEAGAALERANKVVDALEFYESVMNEEWGSGRRLVEFGERRWVVCKFRHAEVAKSSDRKQQLETEAQNMQDRWRVESPDTLPRFPEVSPSSPPDLPYTPSGHSAESKELSKEDEDEEGERGKPKRASTLRTSSSKLQVTHQRGKRRIKIEEKETGSLLFLEGDVDRVEQHLWSSPDLEPEMSSSSQGLFSWKVSDWDIRCEFESGRKGVHVHIIHEPANKELLTVVL